MRIIYPGRRGNKRILFGSIICVIFCDVKTHVIPTVGLWSSINKVLEHFDSFFNCCTDRTAPVPISLHNFPDESNTDQKDWAPCISAAKASPRYLHIPQRPIYIHPADWYDSDRPPLIKSGSISITVFYRDSYWYLLLIQYAFDMSNSFYIFIKNLSSIS